MSPVRPGRAPGTKARNSTEVAPWPPPPGTRLRWAVAEQELLEALPVARERLKKARATVEAFRELGVSPSLLHVVSQRREKLRYEAVSIEADLQWATAALSHVASALSCE